MKKLLALSLIAVSIALTGCSSIMGGSEPKSAEMKQYRDTVEPLFAKSQEYALECCAYNEEARKKIEAQNAAAEGGDEKNTKSKKIDSSLFPTSFASMSTEEAAKARESFLKSWAYMMKASAAEVTLLPVVQKKLEAVNAKLNSPEAKKNPLALADLGAEAKELTQLLGFLGDDAIVIGENLAFFTKYAATNNIATDAVDKVLKQFESDAPEADTK